MVKPSEYDVAMKKCLGLKAVVWSKHFKPKLYHVAVLVKDSDNASAISPHEEPDVRSQEFELFMKCSVGEGCLDSTTHKPASHPGRGGRDSLDAWSQTEPREGPLAK